MEKTSRINTKLIQFKKCIYRDRHLLLIFFLPLLYFIIFRYIPMYGIIIAFKDFSVYKGFTGSIWVGFKYFKEFFESVYFGRILFNTIALSLYGILFIFPLPIILALLLNEVRAEKFKRTVQTISYLPHFISTVVVVGLVVNFLSPSSGIVNQVLSKFGVESIYFMVKPECFPVIYIIMSAWKSVGWDAIIYIAALTSIDSQQYEAAIIDGASRWQRLIYITLPGISQTIVIMLIIRLGGILSSDFESIILMYNPAIYSTADVISTFVYRTGIVDGNYSYGTAVNLFQNIIGYILVLISNKISNKLLDNGLW